MWTNLVDASVGYGQKRGSPKAGAGTLGGKYRQTASKGPSPAISTRASGSRSKQPSQAPRQSNRNANKYMESPVYRSGSSRASRYSDLQTGSSRPSTRNSWVNDDATKHAIAQLGRLSRGSMTAVVKDICSIERPAWNERHYVTEKPTIREDRQSIILNDSPTGNTGRSSFLPDPGSGRSSTFRSSKILSAITETHTSKPKPKSDLATMTIAQRCQAIAANSQAEQKEFTQYPSARASVLATSAQQEELKLSLLWSPKEEATGLVSKSLPPLDSLTSPAHLTSTPETLTSPAHLTSTPEMAQPTSAGSPLCEPSATSENTGEKAASLPSGISEGAAFASLKNKVDALEQSKVTQAAQQSEPKSPEIPEETDLQKIMREKERENALQRGSLTGTTAKQRIFLQRQSEAQRRVVDPEYVNQPAEGLVDWLLSKGFVVPFSERELDVLYGFFELHDEDGSNSLGVEELVLIMDGIGKAPAKGSEDAVQFERLMLKADTDNSGELNFQEFATFLAEYYQSVYARLFVEFDSDRSGLISKKELKKLMVKLRESGFKVRGEDMADLVQQVDREGDGNLDWPEFCHFMCGYRKCEYEFLKDSAGFTEIELDYLKEIFDSADFDRSDELDIKEMLLLLETRMLGSQVETSEEINNIAQLFSRLDKDKSMTLDFLEFLRLLRVWSYNAKQDIMQVFTKGPQSLPKSKNDAPQRGSSSSEVFANKAKVAERKSITTQMNLEDSVLSTQYDVPVLFVRSLRDSFFFYDHDDGIMNGESFAIILQNSLFAPITTQQRKAFSETLERSEFSSKHLAFPSLVLFLAMYHEACVEEVSQSLKQDEQQAGVPVDKLVQAFDQLGHNVEEGEAMALLEKVGGDKELKVVDNSTFQKMLDAERSTKILAWRETCGFSRDQLSTIRQAYSRYVARGETLLSLLFCGKAVFDALEVIRLDPPPEDREWMMTMLVLLDRQGDDTIAFEDFLLFVRHLENQRLAAKAAQENEIAELAGFDADTVQKFRDMFNDCQPTWSDNSKVEILTLQQMFAALGFMQTFEHRKALKKAQDEVTNKDYSGIEFFQLLDIFYRLESQGISPWRT